MDNQIFQNSNQQYTQAAGNTQIPTNPQQPQNIQQTQNTQTPANIQNPTNDISTSTTQTCNKCSKQFILIPQEKTFYQKKELPWPTVCPECRQKTRLEHRNERKLHNRKCDQCQKEIISTYAANSKYTVYCQECFWQHIG